MIIHMIILNIQYSHTEVATNLNILPVTISPDEQPFFTSLKISSPIISSNLPGHSKTFSLRPRSPTSLLLLGKRYLEDLEEEGGTFPKEFLDALLDDVGRVSKRRAMV